MGGDASVVGLEVDSTVIPTLHSRLSRREAITMHALLQPVLQVWGNVSPCACEWVFVCVRGDE